MNKPLRLTLSLAAAALATAALDAIIRSRYNVWDSPLRILWRGQMDEAGRNYMQNVVLGGHSAAALGLTALLGFAAAWVLTAPHDEAVARQAIGEAVLDGAVADARRQAPLSSRLEQGFRAHYWLRFRKLFED